MDKNAALKYSKEYANRIKKQFPSYRIVVYDSYVSGEPTEESDIDIAVITSGFSGNWLKISSKLWEETENVNTKIEPVLLDTKNDPSGFCEHVLKTGIEL